MSNAPAADVSTLAEDVPAPAEAAAAPTDAPLSPTPGAGVEASSATEVTRHRVHRALLALYNDEAMVALVEAQLFISRVMYQMVAARVRRRLLSAFHTISRPGEAPGEFDAIFQAAAASEAESAPAPARAAATALLRQLCLPLFRAIGHAEFRDHVATAQAMRKCADLRSPHTWYPLARGIQRRIVFHAGPTNSGKTYRALQALREAHSGLYCGPLRLLALEVFETLNADGVPASLATGQERREMPFSRHRACTVEMVDTSTLVDVAVIDEIQLIGDRQRGAAFTRALLGLAAAELHVCGDPAALPALTALAALCGDSLEVREYSRMTQLRVQEASLGADYGGVQEGDCVVAFSRKDVYAIRRTIERKTPHKCCVVYGTLPPETRSQQARLFNDPAAGFRVLVSTDAVGMGLNLNIRRVVFHSLDKFDGEAVGPVSPAHVKQIAGRAGRRSSIYPQGFATALQDADMPYLRECMGAASEPITAAGLFPNTEQLLRFAEVLPADTGFGALIERFVRSSHLDGPYFMCRDAAIKQVAELLQPFPLTLEQRCALALAPVNLRNLDVRAYFTSFLAAYCSGQPVRLHPLQLPLDDPSYLSRDLEALEVKVQALDVYMWLGQRLGALGFCDLQAAGRMRLRAADMLEGALTRLSEDLKTDWERSSSRRSARLLQQQQQHQQQWDRDHPRQGTGGRAGGGGGNSGSNGGRGSEHQSRRQQQPQQQPDSRRSSQRLPTATPSRFSSGSGGNDAASPAAASGSPVSAASSAPEAPGVSLRPFAASRRRRPKTLHPPIDHIKGQAPSPRAAAVAASKAVNAADAEHRRRLQSRS